MPQEAANLWLDSMPFPCYPRSMNGELLIQGRMVTPAEIDLIRQLLASHPDWGRTRLSQELCRLWDWRAANGRPKDMACRSLLRKLDQRGLIELPLRQSHPRLGVSSTRR